MKRITKKGFSGVLWALLLAVTLSLTADLLTAALGRPLPLLPWAVGSGALFLLLALLPVPGQVLRGDFELVLLLLFAAAVLVGGFLVFFSHTGAYSLPETEPTALYAGRRVLIVLPEARDETALVGGLAEQYVRSGSEVWVYDCDAGEIAPFGGAAHDLSLDDALEDVQPDVVIGPMNAGAASWRGAARLLDAALDAWQPATLPLVLLGRETDASADFYSANILSTQKPAAMTDRLWESRLRLPVGAPVLSRSLLAGDLYAALVLHGALTLDEAEAALNGDRVFWLRSGSAPCPGFVKLTDSAGNFLYDYYLDARGKETFSLYTVGDAAEQVYRVAVNGERCSALFKAGKLEVSCPKGRSCTVTVTSADGLYSDTVTISNPGRFYRSTVQAAERRLLHAWENARRSANCIQFAKFAFGYAE